MLLQIKVIQTHSSYMFLPLSLQLVLCWSKYPTSAFPRSWILSMADWMSLTLLELSTSQYSIFVTAVIFRFLLLRAVQSFRDCRPPPRLSKCWSLKRARTSSTLEYFPSAMILVASTLVPNPFSSGDFLLILCFVNRCPDMLDLISWQIWHCVAAAGWDFLL